MAENYRLVKLSKIFSNSTINHVPIWLPYNVCRLPGRLHILHIPDPRTEPTIDTRQDANESYSHVALIQHKAERTNSPPSGQIRGISATPEGSWGTGYSWRRYDDNVRGPVCWCMFMRFFNGVDAPGEASQAFTRVAWCIYRWGEVSTPHELSQYSYLLHKGHIKNSKTVMESLQAPVTYVNASLDSLLFADKAQFGFSIENSLVSRAGNCDIGEGIDPTLPPSQLVEPS